MLQASGSAPEAQTLHQLSKAQQHESLEEGRLNKDLQILHTGPSTLGPIPYPQTAATAATIAASEQVAQQTAGVAPAAELQLQAASALLSPDQPVASTAAASADTAAAVTAVESSAPADSTHADKPPALTAVNDADVADPELGNDVAHADGSEAVASDEDAVMPQALHVTQEDSQGSKMPDAPKDEGPLANAVLPLDTRETDRQKEANVHDHIEEEEQQVPGASEATCTETTVQQPVEDELQEEPQQSKSAAPAKPKGKRKAVASLKGKAKRQKGKQDDREASPAADTAAGKTAAPSQNEDADAAPARPAAAAAKPAASKSQSVEPAAAKQGGRTVKKGASSASGAGIKRAAAKPSAAATKKGGAAISSAKRKASAVALAGDSDADDTDNDKADHSADNAPDKADQAVEAAAAEADDAVAAPPVTRDRRNKAKEAKLPAAPQPAQPVKKATKQQKLPFTKAAPSSPKPGKGADVAVAAAASAGTGSKTSKGKASDKKSGASSEPASSAKEPKGKQVHNICLGETSGRAHTSCCLPSWSRTEWCRRFLFACSTCLAHSLGPALHGHLCCVLAGQQCLFTDQLRHVSLSSYVFSVP